MSSALAASWYREICSKYDTRHGHFFIHCGGAQSSRKEVGIRLNTGPLAYEPAPPHREEEFGCGCCANM
uniref:Uncharacterized protein n=1 Tax=Cucumis sativus TaxID=3659 RepID=A0A0A0L4T0_CUCSA